MSSQTSYTFVFITNANDHYQERRRSVDLPDLLHKFDQAAAWLEAPHTGYRLASVYGPNLQKSAITPATRRYIIETILAAATTTEPKEYIGLAWMSLDGSGEYTMHKVYRQVEHWTGYEEPVTVHGIESVDAENIRAAFTWAKERRWTDWGVWFRGQPGIVFAPDLEPVQVAFQDLPGIAAHLDGGVLQRAPVRFSVTQAGPAQPYIRTTRKTHDIQRLRSQYPTASEDLASIPQECLILKYGYSVSVAGKLAAATV
jgi:hypothetical protein